MRPPAMTALARKAREQLAQETAKVGAASSFAVHFRKSPHESFNETAATIAEAIAIARRLNEAHGRYGRRAMIYAVDARGSTFPIARYGADA
jgi:hypothetical protein